MRRSVALILPLIVSVQLMARQPARERHAMVIALLDPAYIAKRRASIDPNRATPSSELGPGFRLKARTRAGPASPQVISKKIRLAK